MQGIQKYIGVILEILCVCMSVFVVFGLIPNWKGNIFLFDDNYTQWIPIIDNTYGKLFAGGKLNIWDMHLMNGINILDTGIYSVLNPFMLLSYIIYRGLGVSNTISIYIYMIVSLSMLVYSNTMKYQGVCFRDRMAFVFCLLGCSSYYKLGNWYYVFNNLFIGSLLLYYFMKVKNKYLQYLFAGSVLGFSIYMGNVQYTLMWYMVFSIIMFMMALLYNKKYLVLMIVNELIAVMVSIPQIILNARASAASAAFSGKNSAFFDYSLHFANILVRGMIPECVIQFFANSQIEEYYFSYGFYFNGIFWISFLIAIVLLIRRKNRGYMEKLTAAYIAAGIFVIFYTLGKGYLVADILNRLPVINQFRHLHKAYFILTPILVMTMLYVYGESDKKSRSKLVCTGVCLALINLAHIHTGGGLGIPRNDECVLPGENGDLRDYRVLTMLECDSSTYQYNITADPSSRMTENWPSYYGIYTIGGYNLSYEPKHYTAVNQIMTTSEHFSEFSVGNAVNVTEWIARYEHGEADMNQWGEQIKDNAVKYILLYYEHLDTVAKIREMIDRSGCVWVEKSDDAGQGCVVLQLGGVNCLAYGEDGTILKVADSINGITINGEITGNICLSFLYDENYVAYTDEENQRRYFTINKNEKGYMVIENDYCDRVCIEYRDAWSNMTVVFAVFATLFLGGCFVWDRMDAAHRFLPPPCTVQISSRTSGSVEGYKE